MEKSIEDSLLLKLLLFNNRSYSIGLFSKEGLFVKEEWIRSTIQSGHNMRNIEFNIKTKEVKEVVNEGRRITSNDNDNDNECHSVIDLNEDGIRWEGIVVNGNPFGYGSLYNSSNELIYQGVMIDDKKECFGIDFYPDLGQIEYIGCYWNNERHGFGMLYNRKGELVYEGDWLFGSNDFERNQKVILKDIDNDSNGSASDDDDDTEGDWLCSSDEYEIKVIMIDIDNDRMVHSLIRELVIDEGCGNEMNDDLELCGFENLESIVVKNNALQNLNSLKISDNPVLKSIETENGRIVHDYDDVYSTGTFLNVKSVTITSTLIDY